MSEYPNQIAPSSSTPEPGYTHVRTCREWRLKGRDLRASAIGWEISIPIFSGPLLGFLIDRNYGTGARWTIILLLVGLLTAVYSMVKYVRYEIYVMKKEIKESKASPKGAAQKQAEEQE